MASISFPPRSQGLFSYCILFFPPQMSRPRLVTLWDVMLKEKKLQPILCELPENRAPLLREECKRVQIDPKLTTQGQLCMVPIHRNVTMTEVITELWDVLRFKESHPQVIFLYKQKAMILSYLNTTIPNNPD